MQIEFIKMQGCGDDAVLLGAGRILPNEGLDFPALARCMLDRNRGVGGNSLNLLVPGAPRGIGIRSFDAKGDEGRPSCNALRCAAKYASDSGAVSENQFLVDTSAGPVLLQIIDSSNVRVDMGVPLTLAQDAEIKEKPDASFTRDLLVEGV